MAVVWKFVDRPEAGANVLLDMSNGDDWYLRGDGFDVSPPPRRRSVATNSMTDGGLVTSASYDLRELKFTLELRGTTEDDRNDQLKALDAEFTKPTNLLMYMPERGTVPVFFQTVGGDFALDNQLVPGKKWAVTCVVLAQPLAIGERHDILAGVSLTHDPASGANPAYLDITGVRGDMPSPAFVRVGTGFSAGVTMSLGQRSQNNPTAVTLLAQAESGTLGTDTIPAGHDTTMSGAGSPNPVLNPGFEVDTAQWTPAAGTLTRDTAQFHSGVASGRYNATSASGTRVSNSNSFVVTEGVTYSGSAWVRAGTTFTGGRVNIRFFDASAALISTIVGATITLSSTWQEATVSALAPAGSVTAHVRVEFSPDPLAVAASAYFDDVTVSPGANFIRTSFATNTLITRTTVTVPTATSPEALRGQYRVFVRVRRTGASDFWVRFQAAGVPGTQVRYTTAMSASAALLDLGMAEFPLPGPVPSTIGYSGLAAGFPAQALEIQAQRVNGASSLDIDYVYLLPADERLCSWKNGAAIEYMVLDGPNDMTYGMASGSDPFNASVSSRTVDNGGSLVPRIGGLPLLVPGETNRWHILRAVSNPSTTSSWSVSYWPLWLEVATS